MPLSLSSSVIFITNKCWAAIPPHPLALPTRWPHETFTVLGFGLRKVGCTMRNSSFSLSWRTAAGLENVYNQVVTTIPSKKLVYQLPTHSDAGRLTRSSCISPNCSSQLSYYSLQLWLCQLPRQRIDFMPASTEATKSSSDGVWLGGQVTRLANSSHSPKTR